MAESIFKFEDKFGYESPFGDWISEMEKEREERSAKNKSMNKDPENPDETKIVVQHVIKEGDTYSKIVLLYPQNEVTAKELESWNGYPRVFRKVCQY